MGPDEYGITRVTFTRLPEPCQDIEVVRHLGKPLEPVSLGPSGPTVVVPVIVDP